MKNIPKALESLLSAIFHAKSASSAQFRTLTQVEIPH